MYNPAGIGSISPVNFITDVESLRDYLPKYISIGNEHL
jgi:hypothetical protein